MVSSHLGLEQLILIEIDNDLNKRGKNTFPTMWYVQQK